MSERTSAVLSPELRRRIEEVADPELPVVTIADLGILRSITERDRVVEVTITPTYAGCPAMDAIRADIMAAARPVEVVVRTVLAPAWSTDDISARGRARLAEHGIAPPAPVRGGPVAVALSVRCPRCGSPDTREQARFSATACKALRVCVACSEPFEHVKPL